MKFDEAITIDESFFYQSLEMEELLNKIDSLPFNLDSELSNIYSEVFNFSVDDKKRIRLSTGIIAFNEKSDNDINYVPRISYGPTESSFSNQNFILTLPNPSTQGIPKYQEFRLLCLGEIKQRMEQALIKTNELVQKELELELEDLNPTSSKKNKPR